MRGGSQCEAYKCQQGGDWVDYENRRQRGTSSRRKGEVFIVVSITEKGLRIYVDTSQYMSLGVAQVTA